jgi:hypothetical protein
MRIKADQRAEWIVESRDIKEKKIEERRLELVESRIKRDCTRTSEVVESRIEKSRLESRTDDRIKSIALYRTSSRGVLQRYATHCNYSASYCNSLLCIVSQRTTLYCNSMHRTGLFCAANCKALYYPALCSALRTAYHHTALHRTSRSTTPRSAIFESLCIAPLCIAPHYVVLLYFAL